MGNRASSTKMVHVEVELLDRTRTVSGFVAGNAYTLPFALPSPHATVNDLLALMNTYREHPIQEIRTAEGTVRERTAALRSGERVFI